MHRQCDLAGIDILLPFYNIKTIFYSLLTLFHESMENINRNNSTHEGYFYFTIIRFLLMMINDFSLVSRRMMLRPIYNAIAKFDLASLSFCNATCYELFPPTHSSFIHSQVCGVRKFPSSPYVNIVILSIIPTDS
jgi:hypothetical protein